MALPSSGPISASMIMAEAGCNISAVAALTGNSTSTPATGSMVKLYENAQPTPVNQTAPHAYSEFYSKYFGALEYVYSISNLSLNYEWGAISGDTNDSITINTKNGTGTYTPDGGSPQSLSPQSFQTNRSISSPNSVFFTGSNGVDKFGNNQLWYEISGSGGLATNNNYSGGSGIISSPYFRNTDLALNFDFVDVDNNPGSIYSFNYDDTDYITPQLDYTASFPTGTNVTCSAAIYSEASPSTAPLGLASSGWILIDPHDIQFKSNNGVESPDHPGEWHVTVIGETSFFSTFGPVFVKPVFAYGLTTP